MVPTTSNDDDDDNVNDNTNWRLVGAGKSNTPMRKGKQQGHGAPNASLGYRSSEKNSSKNDEGGFKATVTSGTVEVSFMTDPAKRSSFNLCMRLR
jgi:hypothetical protein